MPIKQHLRSVALALAAAASVAFSLLAAPLSTAGAPPESPQSWPQIQLVPVTGGLFNPSAIANAGDGSNRLFVASTSGRIWIVRNGQALDPPFLNINSQGEGNRLFGLAFSPDYAADGHFYVHYMDNAAHVVIARYRVSADNPDLASSNSKQVVLRVPETALIHSGGQLAFGPDGYLYIAVGDGDLDNDPENDAQNPANLLGTVLRIDVTPPAPLRDPTPRQNDLPAVAWLPLVGHGRGFTYSVPADNPFVQTPGYRPEIWAWGLRNPWRFSFDSQSGDLYIGDVGQSRREEVNFQSAGSAGGQNYGWRITEGNLCYEPGCDTTGLTMPVYNYSHTAGNCAVIGGQVYRGWQIVGLGGIYVYGDHCSGRLWGLRRSGSVWENHEFLDSNLFLAAFGSDEAGNLFVVDHQTNATLYRIAAAP